MDDVRFTQMSYGPAVLGIIPAACLVLLVWMVWRSRKSVNLLTRIWVSPYIYALTATCVWYVLGIGTADFLALAAFCAVMLLCSLVTLSRNEVLLALPARSRVPRALVAAAIAGTCALEFTCNDTPYLIWPWFLALEVALVLGNILVTWLLSGRYALGAALGLAILEIAGIAQHYVLEFRGSSILPSDLFATGTALNVSSGYTYSLSSGMLAGMGALGLAIASCTILDGREWVPSPKDPSSLVLDSPTRRLANRFHDTLLAGAIALAMAALVVIPNYGAVFGAGMDYWWSKDWYGRQGFFPSFIYAWQDLDIKAPNRYSKAAAQEALQELLGRVTEDAMRASRRASAQEQFQANMPNIVIIQNETFCDLSVFNGLNNGYEGPVFWNTGMPDALAQGDLAVSVFGGGTCNTEFEFLTGNSLAFVGTAKYPFSMYDLSDTQSLPRQLSALGYRTIGMHPNLATNWNRDRVYEDLGFQETLFIDEFEGAEEFHTYVSDAATYKKALDLLRKSDEPAFVFDVTMQNHSGYDTRSIPQDMLRDYTIRGLSEKDTIEANEFVACIEESDRALEELVDELRGFDEPTVLVLYGDHHPWFSTTLNDLLYPNEDPLIHAERIHQTSYVVWANYDVAGAQDGSEDADKATKETSPQTTSTDFLAATVLDAIGAPLTDFQQAQLGARKDIRALNASGLMDTDGNWHTLEDPGECQETLYLLELVEYQNFGSKV